MNKGGTVEVAGLKVSMVGADHSAGDWNPDGETTLYLGEPAGFVVELENGFRIYHAGDTAVFGDMALIRELARGLLMQGVQARQITELITHLNDLLTAGP